MDIASAPGSMVHTPLGPRKSGIPLSVLIPAPVSTVIAAASGSHCARVIALMDTQVKVRNTGSAPIILASYGP
ncbi:hypothetical protein Acsp03_41470 [Actinomadura sp. NBRC 104412]|nr:hypothetical protein Acsp03_41470 [Actinomadura sp. NBRC 104412]